MIREIIEFIIDNWLQWMALGVFSICLNGYRKVIKVINSDRTKDKAIAQGVEALLRDRIIDCYHKYEKTGICPIYAKENIKRLYVPYSELGGNDIATELVEQLLEMPTISN